MQLYQNFVGIDVSKEHLDFALLSNGVLLEHQQIANDVESIQCFLSRWEAKICLSTSLFCLEHTGIYSHLLLGILIEKEAFVWLENPIQIKRSCGLTRGKNDKIDAERIARYAHRFVDKVKLYEPQSETLEQLKELQTLRRQLMKQKKGLETHLKERKRFGKASTQLLLEEYTQPLLANLKVQIEQLEQKMSDLLAQDETRKQLYQLVTSVAGVGKITAIKRIVSTEAFTKFDNPREFASYAGIAPFEYSSGKYKGKPSVSNLANKQIKTLLHLCAVSAIRVKGE